MALKPVVIDISHHNVLDHQMVDPWSAMRAAGIRGVIFKATQGTGVTDATYASRRKGAAAAGLRVGAYHFATNGNAAAQVDHFLAVAKPDADTLLALDWEKEPNKPCMSVAQAREFLVLLMQKTGRGPAGVWLYGGNVLKEQIVKADDIAFFAQFPLWLCQYGPKAVLPKSWKSKGYGLWQYSEHGRMVGMAVDGNVDLNVFGGKDFDADWASAEQPATPFVTLVSEASAELEEPPAAKPTAASVAKLAWESRGVWAQVMAVASIVLGYITDVAKQGWDWVMWAIGLVPEIVAETKEHLSTAQEVAEWFDVNWKSISLGVAAVCIAIALWQHIRNKQQLAQAQQQQVQK